ncbi:Omp28-related outer membrane protein [bacterium]|nr:Omp28-related outer membrane protein [bacterium]
MKKTVTLSFVLMVALCTMAFAKGGNEDSSGPFITKASASMLKAAPADIAGQWAPLTPMPKGLGYNTAAFYDGALYNFSGLNATDGPVTLCYKMDLTAGSWEQIASLPEPRLLAMSHTVGDKIYVIGGYSTAQPFTTHGAVLEYDPATDQFTEKSSMPLPVYAGGSFVRDGKIWVLGGGTTSFALQTGVIQIYDPATDSWELSNSMLPQSLRSFQAVCINDVIYFVGGYRVENSQGIYYANVYKGEITDTDVSWTKLTDFAAGGIMRQSMGTDGTKMYLTGGFTQISQTQGVVPNQTYSFDPSTETWANEAMKITGTLYASRMLYDGSGKFYVVGGQSATEYTDAVEVFDANAESTPILIMNETEKSLWVKKANTYGLTFPLGNVGGAPLQWEGEVEASASWLTLDAATSGLVEPGMQTKISLEIDPTSLAEGEYTGVVTLTTNDPQSETVTYTVTINVQEADVDEDLTVLVEQYTGTWCQYCPFGADSLNAVAQRYGDRMVRMAWHDSDPMEITEWDDMNSFIGVSGFPTASINRVQWEGESGIPISRGDWGNSVAFLLNNMRSPVNLTLSDKDYDETTKTYSFTAKTFFHQGMTGDIRISAVVTEDDFDYAQKKWTSNGVITISPYIHTDVVMGIYPDIYGYRMGTTSEFATQSEYTQEFSFTSPHVKSDKAWISIFVHKINSTGPGQVYQAYQEPLMQGITLDVEESPAPGSFALHQNYPNPFNPTTTISFDVPQRAHVVLTLHDALGRNIGTVTDETYEAGTHNIGFDASELTSGTYYLTMVSGDVVKTSSMTLVK